MFQCKKDDWYAWDNWGNCGVKIWSEEGSCETKVYVGLCISLDLRYIGCCPCNWLRTESRDRLGWTLTVNLQVSQRQTISLLSGELQLTVRERHQIKWHWFILWESSLVWGNADKWGSWKLLIDNEGNVLYKTFSSRFCVAMYDVSPWCSNSNCTCLEQTA